MRECIGSWKLPDGAGTVEAYLLPAENKIVCEWPPSALPLSPDLERHYLKHIAPAIAARVKQRLGVQGNALWVLTQGGMRM